MNVIEVKNVTYSYGGDNEYKALQNVSLDIKEGEFLAILGHNGSGKSTLAKLLNGLFTPTQGAVTVFGMDTSKPENSVPIKRRVGIVFQNPDNQIVTSIVEDDVAFGPENLGLPSEEIRRRVDDALDAVGMSDRARSAPYDLSGGQKQRIAIAGVLAIDPDVMIFDEATAMLDPKGRADIMKIINTLRTRKKLTVIMITQYLEEARDCDRVLVFSSGKIVMEGTPEYVFSRSDDLRKAGIDSPESVRFSQKLVREHLINKPSSLKEDDLCREIAKALK